MVDEFSITNIDQGDEKEIEDYIQPKFETSSEMTNQISNQKVLQLKNNLIPNGLVLLENLFDKNDVPHKPCNSTKRGCSKNK